MAIDPVTGKEKPEAPGQAAAGGLRLPTSLSDAARQAGSNLRRVRDVAGSAFRLANTAASQVLGAPQRAVRDVAGRVGTGIGNMAGEFAAGLSGEAPSLGFAPKPMRRPEPRLNHAARMNGQNASSPAPGSVPQSAAPATGITPFARPSPGMTPTPRIENSVGRALPANYFAGKDGNAYTVTPGAFGLRTPTPGHANDISPQTQPVTSAAAVSQAVPGVGMATPAASVSPSSGTPAPAAGNVPVTTITANPSANGGPQFWQDQAASFPRTFTRPQPRPAQTNPAMRATGLTFDDTVRRLEMAQNRAEWDSKKVQRSRGRDAVNQQVVNFWADQAASIPGAETRMAEQQAQQQGETARADAANQMQANIAAGRNATDLAATSMRQQGETARAQFRRPTPQLTTLEGGRLASYNPDGSLTPVMLPDGSPAVGQSSVPQVDQRALSGLTTSLYEQVLGTNPMDGLIYEPGQKTGRRPTAEEQQAAFAQASQMARSTLVGTNPRGDQSVAPNEAQWIAAMRQRGSKMTDEQFRAAYQERYGG